MKLNLQAVQRNSSHDFSDTFNKKSKKINIHLLYTGYNM